MCYNITVVTQNICPNNWRRKSMKKRYRINLMVEQVKQSMNDLYREHRNSVIHFDYDKKTAHLFVDGKDEGYTIFGTMFEALKKLANGAKTCTVEKAFERMQEAIKRRNDD